MPARKGDKITQHIHSEFINETVKRNRQLRYGISRGHKPPDNWGTRNTPHVYDYNEILVRNTSTTAKVIGTIVPLASFGVTYDTSINQKTTDLPIYDIRTTVTYNANHVAVLIEPLPGEVGALARAVYSGVCWCVVTGLSTRVAGDNCFIVTPAGAIDWAPNGRVCIMDDSRAPLYQVVLGPHGFLPVMFQYQLTSDWTGATPPIANCNRYDLYDGTYQRGVEIGDPRLIMTDQVTNDQGYMVYQNGKYVAIQAPC